MSVENDGKILALMSCTLEMHKLVEEIKELRSHNAPRGIYADNSPGSINDRLSRAEVKLPMVLEEFLTGLFREVGGIHYSYLDPAELDVRREMLTKTLGVCRALFPTSTKYPGIPKTVGDEIRDSIEALKFGQLDELFTPADVKGKARLTRRKLELRALCWAKYRSAELKECGEKSPAETAEKEVAAAYGKNLGAFRKLKRTCIKDLGQLTCDRKLSSAAIRGKFHAKGEADPYNHYLDVEEDGRSYQRFIRSLGK